MFLVLENTQLILPLLILRLFPVSAHAPLGSKTFLWKANEMLFGILLVSLAQPPTKNTCLTI